MTTAARSLLPAGGVGPCDSTSQEYRSSPPPVPVCGVIAIDQPAHQDGDGTDQGAVSCGVASTISVRQIDGVSGVVCVDCNLSPATGATGAIAVDAVELVDLLATIDPAVGMLVFREADDAATEATGAAARTRIVHLVERLRAEPEHVAAIRRVPAVNAIKRVHDGVVAEAVDRETLNLLRPPEVVNRQALDAALSRLGAVADDPPVNPTVLVSSVGGSVLVVDPLPD